MRELIFIKLGGGLITDKGKPRTVKLKVIKKLAKEFKTILRKKKDTYFILGNGAGSFGHYEAVKYKLPSAINSAQKSYGFAVVQESVKTLNKIVVDELLKQKIPAISLHQSSLLSAKGGKLKNIFTESLEGFLSLGMIPVIYGDIVYDSVKSSHIFSTEDAFSFLINKFHDRKYKVAKVIYLTPVNGLLDNTKQVVGRITHKTAAKFKKNLFKTEGFDVTGGMRHKIERAISLANKNIKTYITNGAKKKALLSAVTDINFTGTIIE
jgi:isopentenyl phosphate kinase